MKAGIQLSALVLGLMFCLPHAGAVAGTAAAAVANDSAVRAPVEQLHGALMAAMKGGDKLEV